MQKKTKKEEAAKLTKTERAAALKGFNAVADHKQEGFVMIAKKIKEGGRDGLSITGFGHGFRHNDMHALIEALMRKIHPEVAVIGELLHAALGGHEAPAKKKKTK